MCRQTSHLHDVVKSEARVTQTNAVDDNAMHNHDTGSSQYAGDHDFDLSGWSERAAKGQLPLVVSLQGFWGLRTKEVSSDPNTFDTGDIAIWVHFLAALEIARNIIRQKSAFPDFTEYTAGMKKLAFLGCQKSDTVVSEVKLSLVSM